MAIFGPAMHCVFGVNISSMKSLAYEVFRGAYITREAETFLLRVAKYAAALSLYVYDLL